MDNYIARLKELLNQFSFSEFKTLLNELDTEIIQGNIISFNKEFIYYFEQIMGFVNDQYIVDGKNQTLGNMLMTNALINKAKLTPTLIMSFFLEQKRNLNLENICNRISINHYNSYYRMMITNEHDNENCSLGINWEYYKKFKDNPDEFNFAIMQDILHELTHVYQLSRTEQMDNLFDKLTYYDFQKDTILINNGGAITNPLFHQALLSEFMADEQAMVYMLTLSKNHPEYFNEDLIQKKEEAYKSRKNSSDFDYGSNPRKAFSSLISDIERAYGNNTNTHPIRVMLNQISEIEKKSQPIKAALELQGISEKATDSYFNIYLKSLYQFDGQNIVLNGETQEKGLSH